MTSCRLYNATELWQLETSLPSIPSFSLCLDNVLGDDGIQVGSITELVGLPGSGKTQLCLQLCASVQIPKVLGGLSAEALYIDTNTNFSINRFKEILFASLGKCQSLLDTNITIQEDDALRKLHYIDAFGLEKFCACIQNLHKVIEQHPNQIGHIRALLHVKNYNESEGFIGRLLAFPSLRNKMAEQTQWKIRLIAIDSITFPFKDGISAKQRTGLLFRLMADLQKLALDRQIAVVLTNEMSTRVGLSSGAAVGALGDAWAHRCPRRVLLAAGAPRTALPLKGGAPPAAFKITEEGIRDIDENAR